MIEQKIDPRICGIICECSNENSIETCTRDQFMCGKYAAILALIASEQKDREGELTVAYMMGAEDMKAKNRLLVEALKGIQGVAEVELSEYIGIEVPYIPMRLLGYKQIYNIIDAALKGEGNECR